MESKKSQIHKRIEGPPGTVLRGWGLGDTAQRPQRVRQYEFVKFGAMCS